LALERLEDRIVPALTLLSHYTGQDSALQTANLGATIEPPDTQGAAGPSSVVETVNLGVAIYSPKSSGSNAVTDNLFDFYFTTGGLQHVAANDLLTDPFTIYDPQIQRFIVGALAFDTANTNGDGNGILLAVSKTSNPTTLTTSDWFFSQVSTTESGVALQDYSGNPGYNADALVVPLLSLDSGRAFVHTLVNSISINALASGTALAKGSNFFQTDLSENLPRPTTMPDSAPGDPMWMVASANSGSFTGSLNTIDVIKMTNVLSANPTFTTTTLTVNPYFDSVVGLNPDGTKTDTFADTRVLQSTEANGLIAAVQEVSDSAGNTDMARWYEINVSSGTPVISQQGDVGGTANVYDRYPGVAINSQGDIALTYMQSGKVPGMFESMYITGRTPSDAPGTMETPILVQAGTANYVGTSQGPREGDMSRVSVDADGTFWAFSQWANGEASPNWGTAIAHFTLAPPISIILSTPTEGVPLNNVPVALFLDASGVPLSSYQATINWGDGSPAITGQVISTNTAEEFEILGSHTYTEEGNYTLTVSVNNGKTTIGPVSGVITVADAPLSGFAQALTGATAEFVTNALVAVFSDSDPSPETASNYTATIQWFEGNGLSFSSTGTISQLFNNTFAVYGSTPFTYPSGGLFTVRVVISDVGGASVTVDSVINVSNNPAIPPLVPQLSTDTGPVNLQYVSMEDTLTNFLNAEQLFLTALMFGSMSQKLGSFNNLVNAFLAYEAAVFSYDMQLPGA
jgi:hypothetical protein